MKFEFAAPLWVWEGPAAWYFVTVPVEVADDIRAMTEGLRRGFGSVRVTATTGGTTWSTSIFPDSKTGTFMLPMKKQVRQAAGLRLGQPVELSLVLADLGR
jgi:hypothetical protein